MKKFGEPGAQSNFHDQIAGIDESVRASRELSDFLLSRLIAVSPVDGARTLDGISFAPGWEVAVEDAPDMLMEDRFTTGAKVRTTDIHFWQTDTHPAKAYSQDGVQFSIKVAPNATYDTLNKSWMESSDIAALQTGMREALGDQ